MTMNSGGITATSIPIRRIRNAFSDPKHGKRSRIGSHVIIQAIFVFLVVALLAMIAIATAFYSTLKWENNQHPSPKREVFDAPIIPHIIAKEAGRFAESRRSLREFQDSFHRRYGGLGEDSTTSSGENKYSSHSLLARGIKSYGNVNVTAKRLLRAHKTKEPFVMAFAGYSVTVGRGNYFHQSFPFVMKRLLEPLFKQNDIQLEVRNAAIGGIPSFPYGFCQEHFLGTDADVISWDYGMNEGKGANILESYIRHSLTSLPKQPMFILVDNNPSRYQLLAQYTRLNLMHDAISLKRGIDILPVKMLEEDKTNALPEGLQNWTEFGAPPKCPGRSSWHPKLKEHEFMGWLLAMHFVTALEKALDLLESNEITLDDDDSLPYDDDHVKETLSGKKVLFHRHLQDPPKDNPRVVNQLLYGHSIDHSNHFEIKDVSCRTSFLPAVDHDKTLLSVVVSGLIRPEMDMMEDRGDNLYQQGWVLDVSKVERDTKRKVERCGGLGYIDMKIALYGIPQSGVLRLFLPYEGKQAKATFVNLVLCEANEKRDGEACQLDQDLRIEVGGVTISQGGIQHIDGAGVYLNRKTCVHVPIPHTAALTKLSDVKKVGGGRLSRDEQRRLVSGVEKDEEHVGLVVDITASNRVTRKKGACCLSHIIWEQN